jgi:3-oxo-5-alpha-steroid 4-dehydrogenase 1
MEKSAFTILLLGWMILACIVFAVLMIITAPYGRHSSRKWGVTIPNSVGWILMEAPALLIFLYFFLAGNADKSATVWIIVILFTLHYINRSLVYPLRIRTKGKEMPLLIVFMAICFNAVNGFVNGYFLGSLQDQYNLSWMYDMRFIAGTSLFLTGMIINVSADERLIRLRKNSGNGYQIPYGRLFNRISCPNFFGEIVEWAGFALLCWSLPALSFFMWTLCNLVPRAIDHHRWYKRQFADYPAERKAVIPYLI